MPGAPLRRDRVRTGAKPDPCVAAGRCYASKRDGPQSRSTTDSLERADGLPTTPTTRATP